LSKIKAKVKLLGPALKFNLKYPAVAIYRFNSVKYLPPT